MGPVPDPPLGHVDAIAGGDHDAVEGPIGPAAELGGRLHEGLATCGRRLVARVGDLVGDAAVDLVAEAGEHRQRRPGDRLGDRLGVEHGQLVAGTAPPDDDDRVEPAAAERVDRRGDHLHGALALDAHVADRQPEPHPAHVELVVEVVPRGAAHAGDDADAQRDHRQPAALVGVDETGRHEPAQHLVALHRQVAEREAGVEPAHLQAEAAGGREVVEVAVDAHLHAVAEHEPVAVEELAQALALGRKKATGMTALVSDWSSASVK